MLITFRVRDIREKRKEKRNHRMSPQNAACKHHTPSFYVGIKQNILVFKKQKQKKKQVRLNRWLKGCFDCACVNLWASVCKKLSHKKHLHGSWKERITPFSIDFFHFVRPCLKEKKKQHDEKMHSVRVYAFETTLKRSPEFRLHCGLKNISSTENSEFSSSFHSHLDAPSPSPSLHVPEPLCPE